MMEYRLRIETNPYEYERNGMRLRDEKVFSEIVITEKEIRQHELGSLNIIGLIATRLYDKLKLIEKDVNECRTCNGTGNEICNNPDHGFIEAMPGEIGRLGCPVCGHDAKHRVPNTICSDCKGTGR